MNFFQAMPLIFCFATGVGLIAAAILLVWGWVVGANRGPHIAMLWEVVAALVLVGAALIWMVFRYGLRCSANTAVKFCMIALLVWVIWANWPR